MSNAEQGLYIVFTAIIVFAVIAGIIGYPRHKQH